MDLYKTKYTLDTTHLTKEDRDELLNDIIQDNELVFHNLIKPHDDLLVDDDVVAYELLQIYQNTPDISVKEYLHTDNTSSEVYQLYKRSAKKAVDLDISLFTDIENRYSQYYTIFKKYLDNKDKYGLSSLLEFSILNYGCLIYTYNNTVSIDTDTITGSLFTYINGSIKFFEHLKLKYPLLIINVEVIDFDTKQSIDYSDTIAKVICTD